MEITEIRAPTVREGWARPIASTAPSRSRLGTHFHALWRGARAAWATLLKIPPIKGAQGGVLPLSSTVFAIGHPPAPPSKGE